MRLKPAYITEVAPGQPELRCETLSQKTSRQARKRGQREGWKKRGRGKGNEGEKFLKQTSSFHNLTKTDFLKICVCW